MEHKPVVLVTMGDPAGIGPEICVKALATPEVHRACNPVLIGSLALAEHYARRFCSGVAVTPVREPRDAAGAQSLIKVLDTGDIDPASIQVGHVSAQAGRAAEQFIIKSIELCLERKADAVATAPINKESLVASGSRFIDHTEMYSELTGSKACTMFEVDSLRIFFLTRHVSLRKSLNLITIDEVVRTILHCRDNLKGLGFSQPRIAVAALNPHAGEGGLFGTEEIEVLVPAVNSCRDLGVDVIGPVPADAVFAQALKGMYDAVLSLYHDQGHIAAKTYDFERTVSITLGLPFIRTSVDHGTAFNIAGKGVASPVSLVEAIKAAARYAPRWQQPAIS